PGERRRLLSGLRDGHRLLHSERLSQLRLAEQKRRAQRGQHQSFLHSPYYGSVTKQIAFLAIASLGALAQAPSPDVDGRIKAAIKAHEQAGFRGTVTLYAKNLDSGTTYGIKENEKVRTASTIKLPVMVAVFQGIAEGKWKLNDRLPLRDEDKVSGSGVLSQFSTGSEIPMRDAMNVMIVVSDNTGTNLILERITADYVNDVMDKYGFPETRSMRKVRGDGNQLKAPTGFSKAGKMPENQKY